MMSQTDEQVIGTLRKLLDLCRRTEDRFRGAALGTSDEHLRVLFHNYCQQQGQLAAELQQEIRRLGSDPDKRGETRGRLSRIWHEVTPPDDDNGRSDLLAPCQLQVALALEQYDSALVGALPFRVRQVLNRQRAATRAVAERIEELAEAHHQPNVNRHFSG